MKKLRIVLVALPLLMIFCSCAHETKQKLLSDCDQATETHSEYIRLAISPEDIEGKVLSHKIYLDDTYIGDYYPTKFSDIRGMSMKLEIGEHKISIVSDGFQTEERTFVIHDGIPNQLLRFNLEKI